MKESNGGSIDLWKMCVEEQLLLFGHRNWIVVADSAYPVHSSAGIETIATGADMSEVIDFVLLTIDKCAHLKANIYKDEELELVNDRDALGVSRYRRRLAGLIGRHDCRVLPHDQIIAKLDGCAKMFRVLILKTTLAIPYTSIFIHLECGYWNPKAEDRLRHSMTSSKG